MQMQIMGHSLTQNTFGNRQGARISTGDQPVANALASAQDSIHFQGKDKKSKSEKFFAAAAGTAYMAYAYHKTGKMDHKGGEKVGDAWTAFSRKVDKVGGPVMDSIFGPRSSSKKRK